MTNRTHTLAAAIFLAVGVPSLAVGQTLLDEFQSSVARYVALRQYVAAALRPIPLSDHPSQVHDAIRSLHEAIRQARASAHEGDVFSPRVAGRLRARITTALETSQREGARLFDDVDEDEQTNPVAAQVNQWFPWKAGAGISAKLISTLPPLPTPLEYRFVRRDLVLVDIDADIVVDILRNALPTPGELTLEVKQP
jgi:hypothetical protein